MSNIVWPKANWYHSFKKTWITFCIIFFLFGNLKTKKNTPFLGEHPSCFKVVVFQLYIPSESTNFKDQCCFSWHHFFPNRIHPKCTQNRLLIQQLRLQSFSLPLQPSQEPIWRLDEDWDAEKKSALKLRYKSKKKLLSSEAWMFVVATNRWKEPTDLEERLHKEESHSEDPPPIFSTIIAHHWNGPSRTLSRRKLRYWYLEVASFLVLHGDS